MTVHVFYLYKPSSFNRQDHLVDGFLRSLDLHGHAAVPFIPYPASTAVQLCGMAGTIAKTDTLDPAVGSYVSTDHVLHEHSHVIPIRQIDEKGSATY